MSEFKELAGCMKGGAENIKKRKNFDLKARFIKAGLANLMKFKAVRAQGFSQRTFAAEMLKSAGNACFKRGEFEKSIVEYEQALSIFRYVNNKRKSWMKDGVFDEDLEYIDVEGSDERERNYLYVFKLTIYSNLGAAYMKMKNYENVVAVCDQALKLDPNSIKALFRKSKARMELPNCNDQVFKEIITDLKLANKLNPEDDQISQFMKIVCEQYINYQFKGIESSSQSNPTQAPKTGIEKPKNEGKQSESTYDENSEKESDGDENEGDFNSQEDQEYDSDDDKYIEDQLKGLQNYDQFTHDEKEKLVKLIKSKDFSKECEENEGKKKGEMTDKQASEFWSIFGLEKNYDSLQYDLSYEIDPNKEIPREVMEMGKFIETRGREMERMYEMQGRKKEALQLRVKLNKAMAAKTQLEQISRLDFDRPTQKLQDIADKLGIDIRDESIQNQFIQIQQQNLIDIRKWLELNDAQIDWNSAPCFTKSQERSKHAAYNRRFKKNTKYIVPSAVPASNSLATTTGKPPCESTNLKACDKTVKILDKRGNGSSSSYCDHHDHANGRAGSAKSSSQTEQDRFPGENKDQFRDPSGINVTQNILNSNTNGAVVINNNFYNQIYNSNSSIVNNYYANDPQKQNDRKLINEIKTNIRDINNSYRAKEDDERQENEDDDLINLGFEFADLVQIMGTFIGVAVSVFIFKFSI